MPRGLTHSRSPTATSPDTAVPVATSPMPGSENTRSIASRKPPVAGCAARASRRGAGAVAQMLGERGDAVAGDAGDREDRRVGIACLGEQQRDFGLDRGAAFRRHPVDLGDDPGHLGDPDQFQDVEMFQRLRPRPVIGGDDQQYPVDRQTPASMFGRNRSCPGTSTKPSSVPSGNVV